MLAQRDEPIRGVISRYIYALVPLGFGMWLAHYSFHFLTGGLTLVPVVQSFLADVGLFGGAVQWGLGPVVPGEWLFPIEAIFLYAGAFASIVAALQIAQNHLGAAQTGGPAVALKIAAPWIVLTLLLLIAGLAILVQPMEMRGTMQMSGTLPMISVIITSYREAATIGRALDAFLAQLPADAEILVVCPDPETTAVVDEYSRRASRRAARRRSGAGQADGAQLRAGRGAGEIVVLSDGDVVIGEDALRPLLAPFADAAVGAHDRASVERQPAGYHAGLLVASADRQRASRAADARSVRASSCSAPAICSRSAGR